MNLLTWRLAFRNLFRHKTRFLLNLFLLVGAFSAIVLFKGFRAHVLGTMQKSLVETQFAHLDIGKRALWSNESVDQAKDKMIESPQGLIRQVAALPEVLFVAPRVSFYGLINTEEKSLPGRLVGFDPTVETRLQTNLLFTEGEAFTDSKTAIAGVGLAKLLKVKAGEEVTIVSPTLDGGINAMDLRVTGLFSTGFADVDNGTIFVSMKDAQKVLDTDRVDTVLISLKDPATLEDVRKKVATMLGGQGLQLKAWNELADLYMKVEDFYNFQTFVIEFILLALLVLSVSNTTNMVIFERLGEIGTLRALGDYESDIRRLLLIESVCLGVIAIIIGIPFAYLLLFGVSSLDIPLVLPFTSRSIPLRLVSVPWAYVEASLVCFFSIVLASLWPSYRGSNVPIVTALRAKV